MAPRLCEPGIRGAWWSRRPWRLCLVARLGTRFVVALLAGCLAVLPLSPLSAATITIVNLDAPGEGFNDPEARAPVGGNPGTTLGAQRLNVFQLGAAIWGSILSSQVEIKVEASFDPFGPAYCTATSGVIGSAGPNTVEMNFAGAEFPDTWYGAALANKLAGVDLAPFDNDIGAAFNSDVDGPDCLGSRSWYYGYDGNEGTDLELLPVVLHEIGHGLGFLTFVNGADGSEFFDTPDVYERFMLDISTGKHWDQMTNAERMASAVSNGNLVWDGPAAYYKAPLVLGPRPRLVVNAPAAIAGAKPMGRASYGGGLSTPGLTRAVVLADDGSGITSDACGALVNAGAVSGQIALVDRSSDCTDLVKAQNVQAAGADGILYVDNLVSSTPPTLRGTDPALTLTVGTVRQVDGDAIKAQLASGVNVTLTVDPTKLSGADDQGHPMLYAPNVLSGGSSLSHWDVEAFPNQLMEPSLNASLHDDVGLAAELFTDIGWAPRAPLAVGATPIAASLRPNTPNPFGATTTLPFTLARPGDTELSVFDVGGRLVRRLARGWMEAGSHELTWDGTDERGRRATPGVYLCRLTSGGFSGAQHLVMVR